MVSGKSNGVLRNGLSLLGRFILIVVLCNFICLSFRTVAVAVFTDVTGYRIYGYTGDDTNDAVYLYEYHNSEGEDELYSEYVDKGYTLQKRLIRTDMYPVGCAVYLILSQASCFITLYAFTYPMLWKSGDRDGGAVRFGRIKYDRFKGVKISLFVFAPLLAVFAVFVGLGERASTAAYTIINSHMYSFLDIIYGGADSFGELGVARTVLLGLLTLAVPLLFQIAYTFGFKGISITQKIMYKNDEGEK